MADHLQRVKPKPQYQWYQSDQYLYLRIQAKNTSIHKINIDMTDQLFKVNFKENKKIIAIDLYQQIDYQSNQNITKYQNNILQVKLKKKRIEQWPTLMVDLPKDKILQRRAQSIDRKLARQAQLVKRKEQLKWEYDRKATQQMMRLQDQQREILRKKKQIERLQEEARIFGIETEIQQKAIQIKKKQLTNTQSQPNKHVQQIKPTIQKDAQLQKYLKNFQQLERQQEQEEKMKLQKRKYKDLVKANSMFTNQELQQNNQKVLLKQKQFQNVPIRQAAKQTLKFTQKIYPHLAAREQHYKDPPMPKQKNGKLKINQQSNNPLWLKDKGDKLFKNKDYFSAIQAYNQAISNDDKYIKAIANRSAAHLAMFNYGQGLRDCETVIDYYKSKQIDKQTDDNQQVKSLLLKIRYRKGILLCWKGQLGAGKLQLEQVRKVFQQRNQQQMILGVDKNIQKIEKRIESLKIKQVGDIELKNGMIDKAISKYLQSLECDDQNQFALSNLSLCYIKKELYQQCLQYSQKCINLIERFVQLQNIHIGFSSTSKQTLVLYFKSYLRMSKSQYMLKKYNEAKQSVRKALQVQQDDKQGKQLLQKIENLISKQKVNKLKQQAQNLNKSGKIQDALYKYNQCLKLLGPGQVIEYLSILLNRSVCYLKLQKYDQIISTCIRGLKLIKNQKNRIVSFDNARIAQQDKELLSDREVRFLLHRAKAYSKLSQKNNCLQDLKQAESIQCSNQALKGQIVRLLKQVDK